ncbi:MAG: glycosyltransferase [Syntrophorhabdaceae bacterium]|nr:glycosyltransferase [Syntrophorhabdaceae bacterium]
MIPTTQQFSVIIVNRDGKEFLKPCLQSLREMDIHGSTVEVIVVDNLSQDGSIELLQEQFPEVIVLRNNVNSYVRAVNLGIEHSKGDYVVLLNNDTIVEESWLMGLYKAMEEDDRAGVVQSKIVFLDRETINSVGVEEVEDFYFRDKGFEEKDKGQYEEIAEIEYFTGGSAMIRKACLQEVGGFDEDLIMFFEDIDYSLRCRSKGWKILYSPLSVVLHKFHGSSSSELCDYLCTRNRFLCLAKHFPQRLSGSIKTSHFYRNGEHRPLYEALLGSIKKLIECHGIENATEVINTIKQDVLSIFGPVKAYHFFSQAELLLGLRKMTIGIYDHAFHFPGGGQRYVAKMAEALQDKYDVTYIANKDLGIDLYKKWFNIDLSKCRLKIIKIPFYEKLDEYFINESMAVFEYKNPFDVISKESINYDVFINANMLSKVKPLSALSLFVCHFPDTKRGRFFNADRYDYLISNGEYTASWIKKRWGLEPTHLLYPPVDMYNKMSSASLKKNVILSVARFEIGGSKKQLEMIRAFTRLAEEYEHIRKEWKFIVAGGSFPENPYFKKVERAVLSQPYSIELRPDVGYEELMTLYGDAAIFWHACGLGESDPHLVEHFGMTTVEAMQNYCVPIVIDGGGQKEIVEHGVSGYRFSTSEELRSFTMEIVLDPGKRREVAAKAYERSHCFNFDVFKKQVMKMFRDIENKLAGSEYALKDPKGCNSRCG